MMDANKPLALLLDVDDTLLKEVSIDYKTNANVQSIVYKPSNSILLRYKSIIDSGNIPKDKTIHYEINEDQETLTSYITIRPCFIQIIKEVLNSDTCQLYLVSANDSPRTDAICSQVKINGQTLEEYGFQVIPRDIFMSNDTESNASNISKDIGLIRKWTKMTDLTLAIIVDDKPDSLVEVTRSDHVVGVSPFNKDVVMNYIENGVVPEDVTISEQIMAAMHSLPEYGVSLSFLRLFMKLHITDTENASYTTNEVCQNIVKPKCTGIQGDPSFATLVTDGILDDFSKDEKYIGSATHFTSHAWSYQFSDMLLNVMWVNLMKMVMLITFGWIFL